MPLKITDLTAVGAGAFANTDYFELSVDTGGGSYVSRKISGFEIKKSLTESFVIAVSDETTPLTTGTAKVTFRMPYSFILTAVRASLTTAGSTSGVTTIDINESGTSILSTKLTIDQGEKTSTTASTVVVISDTNLNNDAEITIDIDGLSGGATEAGLKVYLIGYKS